MLRIWQKWQEFCPKSGSADYDHRCSISSVADSMCGAVPTTWELSRLQVSMCTLWSRMDIFPLAHVDRPVVIASPAVLSDTIRSAFKFDRPPAREAVFAQLKQLAQARSDLGVGCNWESPVCLATWWESFFANAALLPVTVARTQWVLPTDFLNACATACGARSLVLR